MRLGAKQPHQGAITGSQAAHAFSIYKEVENRCKV